MLEKLVADVEAWLDVVGRNPADYDIWRAEYREAAANGALWCATDDDQRNHVALVVEKRKQILREQKRVDSPRRSQHRGRILGYEPSLTISSGESQELSRGFFDIDDVPPCGLWLFISGDERSAPWKWGEVPVLFAWVPEELVPAVDAGIQANPYDCIWWISEHRSRWADELKSWGWPLRSADRA